VKVAEVADPGAQLADPGFTGCLFAHLGLDDGVDEDTRHLGAISRKAQQIELPGTESAG
jgi:hypothetical protein